MSYSIQTIMRTSAIIYAEEQIGTSVKSVSRRFIEAVLVLGKNAPRSIEQIQRFLQNEYHLIYLDDELSPILDDERYFVCVKGRIQSENTYYIPRTRYDHIVRRSNYDIETAIGQYIEQNGNSVGVGDMRNLLHRFMFNLLNTNISAYGQLLRHNSEIDDFLGGGEEFSESEKVCINEFLKWENPEKDKAIFMLINYCIEYATAVNKIKSGEFIGALKNKCLYLDNALLYRLLGINGEYRRERAYSLLKRCIESGQKLFVSSVTRKEFFNTIDFHINQLSKSTPYGRINPLLFKKYSNGSSFYYFYHEWRHDRITYGYEIFRNYIYGEYNQLLKKFDISEDFKSPISEDDDKTIEAYADGIEACKYGKHRELHINDAKNLLWLEKNRGNNDHGLRDTKFYFVTTDVRLQNWDLAHSKNQPLTMLPSQWLAMLLKFVSRTDNDYKSFVSFLTIPKDNVEIQPEDLQEILAGISEITEDFSMQDDIISSMLESSNGLGQQQRETTKKFAKEKLEEAYEQKIQQAQETKQQEMESLRILTAQQLEEQKRMFDSMYATLKEEFSRKEELARQERLKDILVTLKKQLDDANSKKSLIEKCVNADAKRMSGHFIFVCLIILVVMAGLIYKIGWDTMEPITYLLGLILTIVPIIYNLITNRTIDPHAFLDAYKVKRMKHYNMLYSFSDDIIEDLNMTIESTEQQLED